MDDNEVEIRVTIRDDTAAGAAATRARAKRLGKDIEKDSAESGGRAGKGFGARFREALSGGGGGGAGGLASKLIGQFTGAFSLSAKTLATGFSYQFTTSVAAGLASGAAKMVHGLGAIGALLPAIAATGVMAFGTVKLAVAGVGDALKAGLSGDTKKFEEGLKGLSPAARGFAHEVVGMRSQLDGLQDTVQQNFFAKFSGETSRLGKLYLPALRTELGGVGSSFGAAVKNAAGFLQTPKAVTAIRGALHNMGQAISNVTGGLGGILQALLPLVTVGSTFLPQLTDGFGGATQRLAEFMTQAAETGKLADFIQGGIDKLRSLGDTAGRVWGIAKNLWAIFKQLGGFGSVLSGLGIKSGGLLSQLEDLTSRAREFFGTSAGGKAMAEAVRLIRELLNATMGMFAKLAGILAPFLPQIAKFATAVQKLMTAIVDAVEPAVEVILGTLLPAFTQVLDWLTRNKPILQGILIALFTLWAINAGIAAAATIAATWPLILLGIAIAALAALVIVHFDTIKKWIMDVFNWCKEHWPLLGLILLGPFGIAILLIIAHLDKIKQWAGNVIDWVQGHWPLLVQILSGPVGIAIALIRSHFDKIMGFIGSLPARIAGIGKSMWGGLKGDLAPVVNWVIDQINKIIRAYNAIPKLGNVDQIGHVGGFSQSSTGGIGEPVGIGKSIRRGGPNQQMAHGGIAGGIRRVAELGRELIDTPSGGGVLVDVPAGSRVHPNGATESMLGGGGGGMELAVTFERTGDALTDAILDALKIRIRKRFGGDPVAALEYRR